MLPHLKASKIDIICLFSWESGLELRGTEYLLKAAELIFELSSVPSHHTEESRVIFFFHWRCSTRIFRLPWSLSGKESSCQYQRSKRCEFDPWVGKLLWKRKWQLTAVFFSRTEEPGRLWSMGLERIRHMTEVNEHAHIHGFNILIKLNLINTFNFFLNCQSIFQVFALSIAEYGLCLFKFLVNSWYGFLL